MDISEESFLPFVRYEGHTNDNDNNINHIINVQNNHIQIIITIIIIHYIYQNIEITKFVKTVIYWGIIKK